MSQNESLAPLIQEVPMVEPEIVERIRKLAAAGFGSKAIARELGIARNTVRRYVRNGVAANVQTRPQARCLDTDLRAEAERLYCGEADGNAVVVAELLQRNGAKVSRRSVQRLLKPVRQKQRAAALASVRFETKPGEQMQIDFGQKDVSIAGELVRVHFLAAVLSYSRRIFVKAFLSERQDDWREGIKLAFEHFGGVPQKVLGDNARALVLDRDRETGTVRFHPAYAAFCRDWSVSPRACWPYRARTKGKTESGVKYVKRNAVAKRKFASFAALEAHLVEWTRAVDQRVHGTTHETPAARFERERPTLRALPANPLAAREQSLRRRVANDAYVDVDTVRYSVPAMLVREHVEVFLREKEVWIQFGGNVVARHARNLEPHAIVSDPAHHASLWRKKRTTVAEAPTASVLESYGRSLNDYAALVERGGR